MAAMNASDVSIAVNGDIRWTGLTTTYNTVLEFHRFLQDLADDEAAVGDDILDITSQGSSDRSTDNIITLASPYNIDDAMAQQLFDGSITQAGGNTLYSGLVVVGTVETGTQLEIVQDDALVTSWWSTGINTDAANNILLRTMIKTRVDGVDIDSKKIRVQAREFGDKYAEFSATLGLGNSTAAIFTGVDLNNTTAQATVAGWSITNVEGYQTIDLNNGNGAQPYYSQWNKDVQSINGLYEFTKNIQRRGTAEVIHSRNGSIFRGITHQWDYDTSSGTFTEDNIIAWGTSFDFSSGVGTFTVGMPVTFVTSGATGQVRYSTGAGATGTLVIAVDSGSGTVTGGETVQNIGATVTATVGTVVDAGAAGGTGLLLADDTVDTIWIQLLNGSPPVNNLIIYEQGSVNTVNHLVNLTVTSRTLVPEFIGASTGTAIIGAFGIGIEAADLAVADSITDLLNVAQSPPNNQTFTVGGLISTEDRVMVANNSGSNEIDLTQFTLSTTLSGATETAVVVTTSIPSDTPSTGTIRIQLDTGIYRIQAYTSWTGSTFSIASTDYTGINVATQPRNVFISYIDVLATGTSESYTAVYGSNRSLIVKVRDGGGTPIKPFKTPATFSSGGGSVTAIRTSDA